MSPFGKEVDLLLMGDATDEPANEPPDSPVRAIPVCVPVTKDDTTTWEKVRDAAKPIGSTSLLSAWGSAQLRNGLGHVTKTVVVEPA